MVRQTKRFKKGLNKKVLSAILAASMIMTSSSFAFAAPLTDDSSNNNDNQSVTEQSLGDDADAADLGDDADAADATGANVNALNLENNNVANAQAKVDTREVTVEVEDCVYNGEAQKPKVTVKVKGVAEPVDPSKYTLTYSNNVNVTGDTEAEKGKVVVDFIGESLIGSHASETAYFDIKPLDLSTADVEVSVDQTVKGFVYNGKKQYPTVKSVKVTVPVGEDEKVLTLSADDYEVGGAWNGSGFYDLTSAGDQWLRINGKGNYTGYVGYASNPSLGYTIDCADLSEDLVNVQVKDYKYDGRALSNSEIAKLVTVTDKADSDKTPMKVSVEVLDNDGEKPVDIGTYNIRIKVTNPNFESDSYIDSTFDIVASESLESVVMGSLNSTAPNYTVKDGTLITTYNGKDQYLEDDEINFGKALKAADYEIVTPEAEWVNAGEYEIVIEGRNTYAGQTVTVPVKILPRSIVTKDGKLVTGQDGFEVTATQGKHQSGAEGEVLVYVHDKGVDVENADYYVLKEGVDYTYTVKEVSDDQSEIEITGIGNYTTSFNDGKGTVYTQSVEKTSTLDLNDPSISVEITGDYNWTGSQVKPPYDAIKVTEQDGSSVRTLTTADYQVIYGENTKAGEGTITLVGKPDHYSGERVVTFAINGVSFADTFAVADLKDVVMGEATVDEIKADAEVTYKATGAKYDKVTKKLYKDGEEAEVKSGKLTETGAYTLVVESTDGQFEGRIEVKFNVIGHDLKKAGAVVADIEDQVYTSEEITPAVTVKVGDKTLKAGEDYEVAYTDNVKGGEATAIITGINNYSGTLEKNFNITRAAQAITMTNPLQERDLGNGSRTSTSKVCTLKLATTMADEDTKYTYTTSDPSVATVNAGKITYQGVGECTITVSAAATDSCEAASLDIKVVVGKPGTPTFTPSVTKNTGKKAFVVTSSTVKGVDGWEVQYSIRDDFWKATTKDFAGTKTKLLRQTCKTVHSNMTYYVRVRGYQTVDGEKVYSDWSPVKTIKTK